LKKKKKKKEEKKKKKINSLFSGEVVVTGSAVEFVRVGDICSIPFNIACGKCVNCEQGNTGVCLSVNPSRPGSAYGYVDMGGWIGGQAEFVMVP
jgi:glutathione-independent formaldehyde dehydrogenase